MQFFGLVACLADPGLITLYVDTFSHSDLYDMYGVEVVESEDFDYDAGPSRVPSS
jgi:hypothetical protein